MTQVGPYHPEHSRVTGSRTAQEASLANHSPPRSFLLGILPGRKILGTHLGLQDAELCLGLPKIVFPTTWRQAICNRKEWRQNAKVETIEAKKWRAWENSQNSETLRSSTIGSPPRLWTFGLYEKQWVFYFTSVGFLSLKNPVGLLSNAVHIPSFIFSPKTRNHLLAVPKCLLLNELLYLKVTRTSLLKWRFKNSRSFLSIWPQAPFSSMSTLTLHFLWKNLSSHSSWGTVLP